MKTKLFKWISCLATAVLLAGAAPATDSRSPDSRSADPSTRRSGSAASLTVVPDTKQVGGEGESVVQVANLIYAGTKTSKCFSDHFLLRAEQESTISTSRRLHSVKMSDVELFDYPLVIMTGEGAFELTDGERANLRKYVEQGGLLLASAGCSSPEWDRSFRAEMNKVFPAERMKEIDMKHPVFHTVYDIAALQVKHGTPRPVEGVSIGQRLGVIYSIDGLNDTSNSEGCCCCGGNEITNCEMINVNILAYALLY